MNETIYQAWLFQRSSLAQRYLDRLLDGSGDPIALVGHRRIGKTTFLLNDLTAEARARGHMPIYVDLRQSRADPLGAINYALQEALDDARVPTGKVGKAGKTTVKKIAVAGFAIDLGEEPARKEPVSPYLLVDWLLKSLVRELRIPTLLMFDEIQSLAQQGISEDIAAAIRSAITKNKAACRVVFTGSSREELAAMFLRSRAPFYEGASLEAFPVLGTDFLKFFQSAAKERLHKALKPSDIEEAFQILEHQPRALIDALFISVSLDTSTLAEAAKISKSSQSDNPHFEIIWTDLTPLQKAVVARIARGGDVSSVEARTFYGKWLKTGPVQPGSVNTALSALVTKHFVRKVPAERGKYVLYDAVQGFIDAENV